jgi:hypothetical protein
MFVNQELSVKGLLYFCVLLLLAGCSQEQAEAPNAPTRRPLATVGSIVATATAEPANGRPIVEAEENMIPATVTAEPTSTVGVETNVEPTSIAVPTPSGALIHVSMGSQVGVLLDEIPTDIREQLVENIQERPEEFWLELARQQIRLTRNRLNFRNFNYPDKGQLPLPPEELWSINLDPAGPSRRTIQGHDLFMIGYTFASTLLADVESPGQSEPALAEVGGVWQEPFIFPADPGLLLQRTDNACVNEGGFPPNSFDSENIRFFYDFDCEADSGGATGCHRTRLPRLSCREALEERIGEVETALRFERLAWDSELADSVRIGQVTDVESPDLMAVGEDLDTNRITYRFVEPEDCALGEGAVGGTGWRRLLQFSATVANIGGQPLNIGPVVAEDLVNNVFSYNPCHDHFHYSNYGDFSLGAPDQTQSSKQAFCVQSTNRFGNNEITPLTHQYSCRFQGIQAGWVDEYIAGLDSQWVDITVMDIPSDGISVDLGFTSNGEQFLCEGTAVLDENDEPVWESSGFTTADGDSINRPKCEFIPNWDTNNRATREIFIPQRGSFVTETCANGEFSPLRNCGFEELSDDNLSCNPGTTVERIFHLEDKANLQVVRVCESSRLLGSGVACAYEDSLSNVVVGNDPVAVKFICPEIRDSDLLDGGYAIYTAPIWPTDAPQSVVSSNKIRN